MEWQNRQRADRGGASAKDAVTPTAHVQREENEDRKACDEEGAISKILTQA